MPVLALLVLVGVGCSKDEIENNQLDISGLNQEEDLQNEIDLSGETEYKDYYNRLAFTAPNNFLVETADGELWTSYMISNIQGSEKITISLHSPRAGGEDIFESELISYEEWL